VIRPRSIRYRSGPSGVPLFAAFRMAYSAAPVAVSTASALVVALGVADMIVTPTAASAGVLVLAVASMTTFAVALGARNERAFLTSVLLISAASAFADLPVQRSDAGVFAALGGAVVLGLIEAGGAALEPKGGGTHVGRPARLHVAWVVVVAVGGALAGWLLLSLQPDLTDLGLVALGLGVLAAVGMIVFTGALTGSALRGTAGFAGGSRRGQAAPGGAGDDAGLNPPER